MFRRDNHPCRFPVIHHRVDCSHQIEVEIWPASAEAYFLDERYADTASAQIRFDATLFNTPSRAIRWEVQDLNGGPGAGTIDVSGLYRAPVKGNRPSGTTEIVVATAVDDPCRKAFARVTLVGRGPEEAAVPRVEIYPRHVSLYANKGHFNHYIDESNKCQVFKVGVYNSEESSFVWTIRAGSWVNTETTTVPWYLYEAPDWLSTPTVATLEVAFQSDSSVKDVATILRHNYEWPAAIYY